MRMAFRLWHKLRAWRTKGQDRSNYIKLCAQRQNDELAVSRKELKAKKELLQTMQQSLVRVARQSVVNALRDKEACAAHFREQFQRLKQVQGVRSVFVNDSSLMIYTDLLFAQRATSNQRFELGEFLILIRFDGEDEPVRWFNLTRRVDALRPEMNAPYVFSDGSPCTTEVKETLLELIGQLELAVVAELAIQFLETIEDDELGRYADCWPRADSAKERK
ncbi:MAG TPA: hypothetical protein V6D17_23440 [Candidatus Obscuribacterales bacterium]